MSRTVIMAIGAVVGVLWIAMALTTLVSAYRGWQHGRYDWLLGWGLVGGLLLIAGVSAIVGTWWHQYRLRDT